jgi:lipocalin
VASEPELTVSAPAAPRSAARVVLRTSLLVFFSLFGFWLFSGDYWIIDLGPNYEYAVIGHPGRSIGWILSRTPQLPEDVFRGIGERLTQKGYNFSRFKKTSQTDSACTAP